MRYTNEDFQKAGKKLCAAFERLQFTKMVMTNAAVAYVIREWIIGILEGEDPDIMVSEFVHKYAHTVTLTITDTAFPRVTPPPTTHN